MEQNNEHMGPKLPLYAIVPGRGKGRVIDYRRGGYFTVLLPGDIRLLKHRNQLIFPTSKKHKTKK
jgi:hypothetical protein